MDTKLKRLKDVMSVQTTSYGTKMMNYYIIDFVKDIPNCVLYKNQGNLYVTRGQADLYPCVVAHTDTVHDIHDEFHVKRHKDVLYAINQDYRRVGIGGDDKVGIFVALEVLLSNPICKVAFFRDEEVGCVGSTLADMEFFDDVSLVMQCDRQGYKDFVSNIFYTDLYDSKFREAVNPILSLHGKVESDGGLTDVYQLTENGLGVACANMSCGYYDPHSDNEYIVISEVYSTCNLVKDIVTSLGDVKWEISQIERNSYSGGRYNQTSYQSTSSRSSYRRYGGGSEASDAYENFSDVEDLREESTVDKEDTSWQDNYKVHGASCTQCDSHSNVCFDDSVDLYWCFGCQDYVREELLEFEGDNPNARSLDEDEFLRQVDSYEDLDDYIDNQEKENDVPF
tara:strand:- start:1019 stop:2206 length:1188 start_codon:yes stop_codon:yes gene_type:complete